MKTETYLLGERKHLPLSVFDEATEPDTAVTVYDTAVVPIGTSFAAATWVPSVVYEGKRGVWVEDLPANVYVVLAKAGDGAPDETDIVQCGYLYIRSR